MEASDTVSEKDKVPQFNPDAPDIWRIEFSIFLMRHKDAHRALKEPCPLPLEGGTAAARSARQEEIRTWEERRNTAYSYLHKAVRNDPTALQMAMNYHQEKEMGELAPEDQQVEGQPPVRIYHDPDAKELLDKLIAHFEGGEQITIQKAQQELNGFIVQEDEAVTSAVVRLQKMLQKLNTLGMEVAEASKRERLLSGLKSERLKTLCVTLGCMPTTTTFEEMCNICRRYDQTVGMIDNESKKDLATINLVDGKNQTKKRCEYPGCKKRNTHNTKECRLREKDKKHRQQKKRKDQASGDDDKNGRQLPGRVRSPGAMCVGLKNT